MCTIREGEWNKWVCDDETHEGVRSGSKLAVRMPHCDQLWYYTGMLVI